jgi:hypothetical protein
MTAMTDTNSARPPRPTRPRALGREEGYVIVVVIAMLAVALAIGAAALGETLSSRSHANRDVRVKRALQAADAGINALLYQQNELPLPNLDWNGGPLQLSSFLDCVVPTVDVNLKITGVTTTSVDANSVCPDTTGAGAPGSGSASFPVGNHAYYQARFIPGASQANGGQHRVLNSKIVVVGYDDAGNSASPSGYVVRRVEAILAPIDPFQAIEATGSLTFQGTSLTTLGVTVGTSILNGNARANGSVTLPTVFTNTNLSGGLFGSVTYGTSITSGIALSHVSHQTSSFARSAVTISPSKSSCPAADASVSRLASCGDFGAYYSSVNNTVAVPAGSNLTIPPGDYVFCNFTAAGTVTANSTATAPVRIFIDNPNSARCTGKAGASGNFAASGGLGNTIADTTAATGASGFQIYVVGDGGGNDNNTSVTIGSRPVNLNGLFSSTPIQSFVVYAPTSAVTASNCNTISLLGGLLSGDVCGAIQGAIIGDNVTIKTTLFTQDLDLTSYPLYSGLGAFHVQSYVECTPTYPAGTTPASAAALMPSPDPTAGC